MRLVLALVIGFVGAVAASAAGPNTRSADLDAIGGPAAKRQAPPNTIYTRYPQDETASLNSTVFVVPAPRAVAQEMAGNLSLLDFRGRLDGAVEADMGAGEHPLLVLAYYSVDVHYGAAPALPKLSSAQVYATFVDCRRDGATPCLRQWAGAFDQLVPALAGTVLASARLTVASFTPRSAPYAPLDGGRYGLNVSDPVVGGALPAPKLLSLDFAFDPSSSSSSTFDGAAAQRLLDSPTVRSFDELCLSSTYFFNETAYPVRNAVGYVEVRSPLLPSKGLASQGLRRRAYGIAAQTQRRVSTKAADCRTVSPST